MASAGRSTSRQSVKPEAGVRVSSSIRSQVNEMHLHRAPVSIQRMFGGLMEVELKEVISYAFDNDIISNRPERTL